MRSALLQRFCSEPQPHPRLAGSLNRFSVQTLLACGLLLPCVSTSHSAEAQDSETTLAPKFSNGRNMVPPESVAVADEGHSFFTNPAGAAFTEPESFSFIQTFLPAGDRPGPGDVGRGIYWSTPDTRFAWTYVATKEGPGQGVLAFSQSRLVAPSLAFGSRLAFHYFNFTDQPLSGLIGLSLGMQARPNRHFSLGLSFDNVLSPQPPEVYSDFRARARLGVGIRPRRDRLTLTFDAASYLATLTTDPGLELTSTLTLEPVPGLRIHGSFEWQDVTGATPIQTVGMGATLKFGNMAIGDQGFLLPQAGGVAPSADTFYVVGYKNASITALEPGGISGQVLEVRVSGDLLAPSEGGLLGGPPNKVRVLHQLGQLRHALYRPSVKAVLVNIDSNSGTLAEMQELRTAIQKVRKAGKRVVAYLHSADAPDLYLASGCDQIVIHPQVDLTLDAPSRDLYYMKSALAKVGVQVDVIRKEAYKTAPEGYVSDQPSAPTLEMYDWIFKDMLAQYVTDIAAGRQLEPQAVEAAFKKNWISAPEALKLKLVDQVAYPDALEPLFKQLTGKSLQLKRDDMVLKPMSNRWGPRAHVGLLYLNGEIDRGAGGLPGALLNDGGISSTATVKAIEEMAEDRTIRAVVVRVDSPGGGMFAADEIRWALEKLRKEKPVVISMGGKAASGGYFISLPGDLVLADPGTLTGSIGVYIVKPSLKGTFEKLELHPQHFTALPEQPVMDSANAPWTPAEQALAAAQVEMTYKTFVERVAEARKLSVAEVEAVAGGRVWTGRQALEHKLIDGFGGLDYAIEQARTRGHISTDAPIELTIWPQKELSDGLVDGLVGREGHGGLLYRLLQRSGAALRSGMQQAQKGEVKALAP